MDPGDPTSILFTKIRTLEPDFASKIIGYLLLQDLDKRDLMRLALGPDTLLQSVCLKAKTALGLSSSTNGSSSSSSGTTPLNPISRPINIHRHSPRNGFMEFSRSPSSLNTPGGSNNPNVGSSPFQASSSLFASDDGDLLDEGQLGNYLSFLNESSSKNNNNNDENTDLFGFSGDNDDAHLHKRSFSASDVCFGSEEPGYGGYSRFPHGGGGLGDDFDSPGGFGSPDYRQQEEIARIKLAQRQRIAAAQFLAASGGSPMSYDKGINFLLGSRHPHRSGGAGQFGDEGYWFGSPGRYEREELMGMGDKSNSASKQIYLTFPADSSFTDEDVSNYFGNFGPVQDVRIPYQQKRMFGFVTFVHSETVRIILARGNPHFICDSRVLVKPYKEKGRILENRRQQQQLLQQMERGNFSPGSSPSGMDARDLIDCHFGPRMFSSTQEMMMRRKAEQADLQQVLEFQRRRILNLQLPDLDSESFHHHQRSLSIGSPVHYPSRVNQSMLFRSENAGEELVEGNGDSGHFHSEANRTFQSDSDNNNSQEEGGYGNHFNKGQETSLENALPDCFFASPSKTGETQEQSESENENCATLSATVESKPASTLQSA
ncbi:hypothetical protein Bca4012_084550 [Brassica carinata]|uniref:RRM domain-containing protein n=1 Tax=Brassica carinata TaxID=52824 RepID=A0A8X7SHK9_BRACI|nr:hypothetical protein Bca52824_026175 [Brassica carinata]